VPDNTWDRSYRQTNAYLPWTQDGHFDSNPSGWSTWNLDVLTRIGGYYYMQPHSGLVAQAQANGQHALEVYAGIKKWYRIPNIVHGQQVRTGSATNVQLEIWARCPSWSNSWSGDQYTSPDCWLTLGVNTAAGIAAGANWCTVNFALYTTTTYNFVPNLDDNCGAFVEDDDFLVVIDSNGYPVDVDRLYVASGL